MAAYFYLKSHEYSKTAVPYIKKVIPEISTWDPVVSKKYMAADVLASLKDEDLNKLMHWLSKLGSLKSIEEPSFVNVSTSATVKNGKQTIATYTILAHYEHGDANITMRLLEFNNGFKVYQFNVNSNALIE
jgi:hypothetical protein